MCVCVKIHECVCEDVWGREWECVKCVKVYEAVCDTKRQSVCAHVRVCETGCERTHERECEGVCGCAPGPALGGGTENWCNGDGLSGELAV